VPANNAEKIGRDLAGLLHGPVRWDPLTRGMYSTAACIFEVEPLVVAAPADVDDVCKLLAYAASEGIPVIPRGGGSSLGGQAVGAGIMVDCSRFMNHVLRVDRDKMTALVQPGVVLGRLNRLLAREGLFFAPDPSSAEYCTIGGMVANNSGGAHSVKYGSTRDHVVSLKAVLPGGAVLDTAALHDIAAASGGATPSGNGDPADIYLRTERLLRDNADLIERKRPRVTKNSSGYNLSGALAGTGAGRAGAVTDARAESVKSAGGVIDLSKLLVGSEGTLGLVVEAELKLTELPRTRGAALSGFSSLESAGEAIVRLLEIRPAALEIMGHTFLALVDRKELESPGAFMAEADTALLLEFEGDSQEEVRDALDRAQGILKSSSSFLGMKVVEDPAEAKQLWGLRTSAVAILNRMEGPEKPIAFIEDVTVEPARLPEFIRGELEIFDRHGVRAGVFGHGGDGDLHVRPVLNLKNPDHVNKMGPIARDVYELAAAMGGSPTGEHGDGRLRTAFLHLFYGEVTSLFREVKEIFDPKGIMNPGDKIAGDDDYALDKNLRYGSAYHVIPTDTIFDEAPLLKEIEKCHGCGACRAYCPVGSATGEEEGSARTKANLLRRLVSGKLGEPGKTLLRDDWKAIFDLCFNCKLCLTECPTKVDVPRLAAEARACYVKAKGLDRASMFVANSFEISRVAALSPSLSNAGMRAAAARSLMHKAIGIDKRRDLPAFSRRPMRVPGRSGDGPHKVLYFPGCFALFNDSDDEGRATIDILEAVGAAVWVPELECCGMARLTLGDKEGVIKRATRNVKVLSRAVRDGYAIVASAASCCLAIKEDYPLLLRTEEARMVAENTYDLFEYLALLWARGEADIKPGPLKMRVVHHVPCHLLAQGVSRRVDQVLKTIPGLEIIPIKDSCCGMAGTFGMKSRNFDLSMRIGKVLFDEVNRASPDVVVTGCGTCKIQLEQGTGLEVRHPIWILHKAYDGGRPGADQEKAGQSFALKESR
jgi:FAD/FMN-containing dehydrogenase/Fe-S oxidoreductase